MPSKLDVIMITLLAPIGAAAFFIVLYTLLAFSSFVRHLFI